MKPIPSNQIKQLELGILDYIADKCHEHRLRYYLAYGTLLGAVRHQGFIPWDDDIDIAMPRPDYEKLIEIVKNDHLSPFRISSLHDADYYYEWAKVYDSRTHVVETNVRTMKMGVWVDIFPLDGAVRPDHPSRWRFTLRTRPRVAAVYTVLPPTNHVWMKPFVWLMWQICRSIGFRPFLRSTDRLSQRHNFDDSPYAGYLADHGSKKHIYHRNMFDNPIQLPFEGRQFYAPHDYDEMLRSLYGDYMQLPPEEQRLPHRMNAYWID